MRLHGRSGGFTLIEILVVIVIIGIVMSIAILSITLAGGDNQLRDEAQRVVALVEVARDESLLQGREFGVEFMQGAYRFVEFDPLTRQWGEIIGDDTLRLDTDGLILDLTSDNAISLTDLERIDLSGNTSLRSNSLVAFDDELCRLPWKECSWPRWRCPAIGS